MARFSRSEDADQAKGTAALKRNSEQMMKIVKTAEEMIMEFELGKSYEELEIGEKSSFSKTISETDVYLFAGISGDFNPLHVNEQYAKTTPFGARVAHGPLTQSLAAPLLGMKLPGLGAIAVEITTRFKAPVYIGDTITVTAELVEKIPTKRWVRIALTWQNQKADVVAEGSAIVSPPRKEALQIKPII